MEKCIWSQCNKRISQIIRKDFPLVNVNSCGKHASYICSLCDTIFVTNSYVDLFNEFSANITDNINWHFMENHTLKEFSGKLLYDAWNNPAIGNCINNNGKCRNYCYISKIIETYPHFIYLVPEFSISDILDMFDEVIVNGWSLLAAVRHKSFSCLICGGLFESFPSNEVFAAHPCKS